MDIDLGAEFVYMAATLIHIKSKMLLPRDPALGPDGETAEDPRQELVDRLLEHERFKNAAEMLQQKRMIEENVWSNPQIKAFVSEDDDPGLAVTLFDLVKAFGEMLERAKNRPVYEVEAADVTVADMMRYLRDRFVEAGEGQPVFILRIFEQQRTPPRHDRAVSGRAGDGADAGRGGDAEGSVRRNRPPAASTTSTPCSLPTSPSRPSKKTTSDQAWKNWKHPRQAADPERPLRPSRSRRSRWRNCWLPEGAPPPVPVEDAQLKAVLEAIVYVAEEPLTAAQMAAALQQPAERIQASARPACRGIRQAGARRRHPGSGRRLQDGHQGGAPRGRPQLRQEPQAAAEAFAAGAGNPGRDRLQAARHGARDHGDPRRAGRRRAEDAARPQADRRGRAQERDRQADPLQDHQGVSDPVRAEGPERAALAQGIRGDPAHGVRRRGAAGTAAGRTEPAEQAPSPPDAEAPAADRRTPRRPLAPTRRARRADAGRAAAEDPLAGRRGLAAPGGADDLGAASRSTARW